MKVHANAALGPAGRLALVQAIESGVPAQAGAMEIVGTHGLRLSGTPTSKKAIASQAVP
jgi:hypothetical protein